MSLRGGLAEDVRALYERREQNSAKISQADCVLMLKSYLGSCERAFIVIDALDELQEKVRPYRDFLDEVLELQNIASVLITSRHSKDLSDVLSQASARGNSVGR